MMALTLASVGDVVPKEATGRAMGLLGTVSAVGTALGPSLGGALIAAYGWPSVFAFMAVAGAAAFAFGVRQFPDDAAGAPRRLRLDVAGTLLLALSLGAYALATTLDASPGLVAFLAAAAGLGLVAFVVVELHVESPLIRLPLLRDRTLSAGLASLSIVSAIVMATLVVGPFYLAEVLRLSAVDVGLVMSVGPGVSALTGVPAGRMVDRLGSYTVALAGLGGVVAGSLLMIALPGAFGVAGYVAGLATITAGYALFQAAGNTAVMNGATADRRGLVSALLALARNLGLVTGASLMGALFALGSGGIALFGLAPGSASGLQLTFAVAAVAAGTALAVAGWGLRRR
jgi:MFS family permease